MEVRPFSAETEPDVLWLINEYTAGWPYTRPVDAKLTAHWRTLGHRYQPDRMLIAYRDGAPRCFLHGERDHSQQFVHLLAARPGAAGEAAALLARAEMEARRDRARRMCGPTCLSGRFYGGYILGLEPYHPHWAAEVTDAFVQAGFLMSQSEALMVADMSDSIAPRDLPPGYELGDGQADPEFGARTFRLAARAGGKAVATCGGRLYPRLLAAGGGPIGQLGFVGTEEQHRGKGLATALVARALIRLKEWGAAMVLISTGLENAPALRAYQRAGFRRKHNLNEWSKILD